MSFPTITIPIAPDFEGLTERDQGRARAFAAARAAQPRIAVGDIIHRANGTVDRASHVWPHGVQPGKGSFHAFVGREGGTDGGANMSGGLDPSIPFGRLELTSDVAPATFWFFRDGIAGAGRGVDFRVPVKVWREVPAAGV